LIPAIILNKPSQCGMTNSGSAERGGMLRREFVFGVTTLSLLASGGLSFAKGIAAIKEMKIGEFIWQPELSPKGPVVVVVSIPHQLVHVYRNGIVDGSSGAQHPDGGLHNPSEARRALFQHIQQCADAEHATTNLARHSPSCRSSSRLS
jgi:hypothetical protein